MLYVTRSWRKWEWPARGWEGAAGIMLGTSYQAPRTKPYAEVRELASSKQYSIIGFAHHTYLPRVGSTLSSIN